MSDVRTTNDSVKLNQTHAPRSRILGFGIEDFVILGYRRKSRHYENLYSPKIMEFRRKYRIYRHNADTVTLFTQYRT